jgi:chromate transport protein ChrA
MKRLLLARLALSLIGIAVWGYGNATEQSRFMIAGMAILAIALLLRFVPKRWLGDDDGPIDGN